MNNHNLIVVEYSRKVKQARAAAASSVAEWMESLSDEDHESLMEYLGSKIAQQFGHALGAGRNND